MELPDGDFIDVHWNRGHYSAETPTAILLHGLTGSIESRYARGMLNALKKAGWRALLMHFRGASEEPNRLARSYHSGDTADFAWLVEELKRRFPTARLAAIGYSLGGNVLLKYLGEQGENTSLSTAIAVSAPYDLTICAQHMDQHGWRVYRQRLLRDLRAMSKRKFSDQDSPIPLEKLDSFNTFHEFDNELTAPLNGFESAADYYRRCSSRQFLHAIRIPTRIIHSRDDPFMTPEVIPSEDELSADVTFELSNEGGHVGFVAAGSRPWKPVFWLEREIPKYLQAIVSADQGEIQNR